MRSLEVKLTSGRYLGCYSEWRRCEADHEKRYMQKIPREALREMRLRAACEEENPIKRKVVVCTHTHRNTDGNKEANQIESS